MANAHDETQPEYESLRVDRAGGVVTITLDRPERKNAINGAMWRELAAVVAEIGRRSADRVVVITGAGGEFCSGADLAAPSEDEEHHLARMRRVGDLCLAVARLPQPTIAKVRGVAVGAGLNLALVCDLVVAAEGARFSEIFAKRGLSLDFGGSWILPRLVGMHRAKELALLARIIDASEAAELGLVNRVLPDAELDAFVDGWAADLVGGPPIALAMTKRLVNNSFNVTLEEALDDEALSQTVNLGTADHREAIAAFLGKRAPEFQGR
ncbi:MAG: enoyl-CoA hydratase/isomerase family protein [Ilumatobacteraceae bacterium]